MTILWSMLEINNCVPVLFLIIEHIFQIVLFSFSLFLWQQIMELGQEHNLMQFVGHNWSAYNPHGQAEEKPAILLHTIDGVCH